MGEMYLLSNYVYSFNYLVYRDCAAVSDGRGVSSIACNLRRERRGVPTSGVALFIESRGTGIGAVEV